MPIITDFMTNDEVMRTLGGRIKERRLSMDMTVEQTAELASMNRKTVLALEAGDDVRLSSLVKIMRALDILPSLEAALPGVLPSGQGLSSRGQPRQKASGRGGRHG